jgi:small subunit ribosomal protein S9
MLFDGAGEDRVETAAESTLPPATPAGGPFWGTGRRKEAVARVLLRPGSGRIEVNRQPLEQYFRSLPAYLRDAVVLEPFRVTGTLHQFDVRVNAHGGGLMAQLEAVRLGIARALLAVNSELRPVLRHRGLLTRDPRMKERKKYGQKGARKRFQFSKR